MNIQRFLKLFLSFFVSQIAFVVIVSTDLIFLGKAGVSGLAGAGLAALIYSSIYMFFHGFAVCYSNISAEAIRDGRSIRNFYEMSVKICSLSLICYLVICPIVSRLSSIALQTASEQQNFSNYLLLMGFSLPIQLYFNLKRYELASYEKHKLPSIAYVAVSIINYLMNIAFINTFQSFGWMLVNAVASASIISWLIGAIFLEIGAARIKLASLKHTTRVSMLSLYKRGSFLGGAFLVESFYFSVIAAIVGTYGTFILAACNAGNNILYIAFMVPVSVSNALSILLSKSRSNKDLIKLTTPTVGICMISITILSGIYFFPSFFLGIYYSPENADFSLVLDAFKRISLLILLFHVCDCFQNICSGVIRAYGKEGLITRNLLLGLWCFGFPCMLIAKQFANSFSWIWGGAVSGMLIVVILHLFSVSTIHQTTVRD